MAEAHHHQVILSCQCSSNTPITLIQFTLISVGPFQGAIALTVLALLLVLPWEENYGDTKVDDKKKEKDGNALSDQFFEGWKVTLSTPSIWKIGLIQALSEGGMYTVRFSE